MCPPNHLRRPDVGDRAPIGVAEGTHRTPGTQLGWGPRLG